MNSARAAALLPLPDHRLDALQAGGLVGRHVLERFGSREGLARAEVLWPVGAVLHAERITVTQVALLHCLLRSHLDGTERAGVDAGQAADAVLGVYNDDA